MAFHPFSSLFGPTPSAQGTTPREGYVSLADLGRPQHHYDPNQPRVAAGHPDGGQWTRFGSFADASAQNRDREVLSDFSLFWILGGQYAANDEWENLDRSHSGKGPAERHKIGVMAAMKDYAARGYAVTQDTEVVVVIAGAGIRRYDFIVQDPVTGFFIGVEVKTTLYDKIFLNKEQVAKDVLLIKFGGHAPKFGVSIRGVGYASYCWGCDKVPDISTIALHETLKLRNIPFTHGGRPGEFLP